MRNKWAPLFASLLISSSVYAIVVEDSYVPMTQADFEHDFSFVASIRASVFAEDHSCGGTIVGNRWVLTAAHCLVASDATLEDSTDNADVFTLYDVAKPKEISVTAGKADLSQVEISNIYKVTHVVIHPDYYPVNSVTTDETGLTVLESTAYQNDLALLYVERDFPSDLVGSLSLANADSDTVLSDLEGEWDSAQPIPNVKVAGWGIGGVLDEEPDIGNSTTEFRETDISYFPISLCFERLESAEEIPQYIESPVDPTKLCTLPTLSLPIDDNIFGNGACLGDTGGPLLLPSSDGMSFTQVGIISAGPIINSVCSSITLPTWYTNVSYYTEWIDSYISSDEPPEVVITKPDFLVIAEEGDDTATDEEDDSVTDDETIEDTEQCTASSDGEGVAFACDYGDDDSSSGSLDYMYLLLMTLLLAITRRYPLNR